MSKKKNRIRRENAEKRQAYEKEKRDNYIKREEAETKINEVIRDLFLEKDVILERVLLRHIAFSPEYASAIEEKQVAEQKIQKAEFQRLEAEKLKEKKIIEALVRAQEIRPGRYTILGEQGLTEEAAKKLAKKTGVV